MEAAVNYQNVVKSFFLGIGIGATLQVLGGVQPATWLWVAGILASGALGLVIGFLTEWLTSLLPLRIARTQTYFFFNNLIAVVITATVMVLLFAFADDDARARWNLWPIIGLIVAIVCVANFVDYLLYARAQRRLHALQAALKDAEPTDADPVPE